MTEILAEATTLSPSSATSSPEIVMVLGTATQASLCRSKSAPIGVLASLRSMSRARAIEMRLTGASPK